MILHINTSPEWRGGEQQLLYLAIGLSDSKIPQLVVGLPESPLETKCKEYGIPFKAIPMKGEFDRKAIQNIRNLCIQEKVSLIHTHTGHAHTLALFAKRKHLKIPLLVSRRVDFKLKSGFFSKWKYKHEAIDYFLPVSHKIKTVLLESGISPDKIITVYSGIDLKRFAKVTPHEHLRTEWNISKKTIVIGNIAALVEHKDQETLLRSIALVKTEIPFCLLIVGEGKLERKLKNLALELGITDRVLFTGYRKDIPALLSLFDIFTLTSKEEGLGTSILDAMASGLPIVATSGGGIGEMLDHEKGAFLSPVGDSESLATSFKTLIESESLRKEMGSFNKVSVKSFSIQNTIDKTKLVYYSFLGDKMYGVNS